MSAPHLPCLRFGEAYHSFNESEVKDYRDGSTKATLSQVNAGIIRRDLMQIGKAREALARFSTRELVDISAKAGELFSMMNYPWAKARRRVLKNIWKRFPQQAACLKSW